MVATMLIAKGIALTPLFNGVPSDLENTTCNTLSIIQIRDLSENPETPSGTRRRPGIGCTAFAGFCSLLL